MQELRQRRRDRAQYITGTIPVSLPMLDRINRRTYKRRGVVRQFENAEGWLDPGERELIGLVANKMRGKPILDLGVGGGRTAPLLSSISADYRGIDYEPLMVAAARRRFPDLSFTEMDARRLSFPDEAFSLVVFSYNGIDSVDLVGRRQVLHEVYRILELGGFFIFSAFSRAYADVARHWPDWEVFEGASLSALRWARSGVRLLLSGFNRLRISRVVHDSSDLAISPIAAHSFGLAAVFASIPEQVRELEDTGFVVDVILAENGARMSAATRGANTRWCYYVARRAPPLG